MVKKSSLIGILSFLIGIVLVNLIGEDYFSAHGIIPFWSELSTGFSNVSYDRYFCYILIQRLKVTIGIILLANVISRELMVKTAPCCLFFLIGIFMTMSIMDRGIYGVVIVLAAMFPQWLCYSAAFLFYAKCREREKGKLQMVMIFVFLLAGCVSEAYVSPLLLKNII